jgi:glycogen synthase kinase 3 beta
MENVPDYEPISLRGAGAFGYVIEAYDRIHDKRVAIKRTHKVGTKLSREYDVLSKLKDCEHVVKLIDTFYSVNDDGKVIQNLVFEYVTRSLEGYMDELRGRRTYMKISEIKNIAKQLLLGLDYCHKKNIVHRDLKPENVLFTEDKILKICDFGSSKFITEKTTSTPYIVSRYYRAPELIFGDKRYNNKIDIFAAGCIIAELFTLDPIFPGKTEGLQLFEQMSILGIPSENYFRQFDLPENYLKFFLNFKKNQKDNKKLELKEILNQSGEYNSQDVDQAADLIEKMLNFDKKKRYSAEQCLNHEFLKNS